MIESPFAFEPGLSPVDYQTLGRLSLKWSHIDHVIGNCLKVALRLTDAEAIVMVFPLGAEQRINKFDEMIKLNPIDHEGKKAFDELKPILKALQFVRNNVVHAIVVADEANGHNFHLRSKQRTLTKAEIFSAEELTNYAAHLVYVLRYTLGFKIPGEDGLYALPDRPAIPAFLLKEFPALLPPKKAKPKSPRRSSRG